MTPDRNTMVVGLVIALAPAAAIVGARHVGSAAGGVIGAEVAPLNPAPEFEPLTPVTDDPSRFAALRSPFRADPEPIEPLTIPLEPEVAEGPKDPAVPEFSLTAVMPHPTRPLAVINARPRAIGDQTAPGWTLTAIDGDARQVTLTGPGGRSVRIRMTNTPRRP